MLTGKDTQLAQGKVREIKQPLIKASTNIELNVLIFQVSSDGIDSSARMRLH